MHLLLPLVVLGLTGILAFPSPAHLTALRATLVGKSANAEAGDLSLSQLARAFVSPAFSSQTDPQGTKNVRWVRYYSAPVFVFLALYSLLPHKVTNHIIL